MRLVDGTYEEVVDDSRHIAGALLASAGPLYPPRSWYEDPGFERKTPMVVTADGRVFGHIATWDQDHIGLPPGTSAPRSNSDYAFFRTGLIQTQEGDELPVGQLTLAGGHAPLNASAGEAVEHYDNTASAVADVTVGEDAFGIWVSGGLRPGVSDSTIRALRASAPSGDWRPINGNLELVAICQVNTPGFPLARAMVASGEITALVAAGAQSLYELQQERSIFDILERYENRLASVEAIVAAGQAQKRPKSADGSTDKEGDDSDSDDGKTDVNDNTPPAKSKPTPESTHPEPKDKTGHTVKGKGDTDYKANDKNDKRAKLRAKFGK